MTVLELLPSAAHAARKRAGSLARIKAHRQGAPLGLPPAQQLIQLTKTLIASATSSFDEEAIQFLIDQLNQLRSRINQTEHQVPVDGCETLCQPDAGFLSRLLTSESGSASDGTRQ